ncbi:SOS response-associated peptidase [Paenibacillus protaetiae]|uniref:Abasic site processing protein n=1 Tax=Paenibacillus protaetiae TaxID=2509456 RepID=A0A4P6EZA0_9BACL|nr:SOS response-associated peptidase [Paenibacillus protaetiae]QAY67139.1 SOS response-associated peptidase [Paenibacillus protaetiae]
MIDKYSISAELADIVDAFQVQKIVYGQASRFNVSPTQNVSIIMNDRFGIRTMNEARWGLFPFWAKDSVNADVETFQHKPYFDRMLRKQRCIVPCSGYFGWKKAGQEKAPRAMHVVAPGQPLFGVPGFYDVWKNSSGQEVRAFTFITAPTSGALSQWMPRMPVVLDEEGAEDWLNPRINDIRSLRKHLEPLESHQLRAYPVTNAVGEEGYESPECIREIVPDFA